MNRPLPDCLAACLTDEMQPQQDIQQINWSQLPISRHRYRQHRLLAAGSTSGTAASVDTTKQPSHSYFNFNQASLQHKCQISHFQLRQLVCCLGKHDVFYASGVRESPIGRWNPLISSTLAQSQTPHPPPHGFRPSVVKAFNLESFDKKGIVCTGGLFGEIGLSIDHGGEWNWMHSSAATAAGSRQQPAGIVTDLELITNNSLAISINQPETPIILLDLNTQKPKESLSLDTYGDGEWRVNAMQRAPDHSNQHLMAVVGDGGKRALVDLRMKQIAFFLGKEDSKQRKGDDDFLACCFLSWATVVTGGCGSGECDAFDLRRADRSLFQLPLEMGGCGSLRFHSATGLLMVVEMADFIHIYDTRRPQGGSFLGSEWPRQSLDFFGEIGGASFSSSSSDCSGVTITASVGDDTFGGIFEWWWPGQRNRHTTLLEGDVDDGIACLL